jgi:hypothetical protein
LGENQTTTISVRISFVWLISDSRHWTQSLVVSMSSIMPSGLLFVFCFLGRIPITSLSTWDPPTSAPWVAGIITGVCYRAWLLNLYFHLKVETFRCILLLCDWMVTEISTKNLLASLILFDSAF